MQSGSESPKQSLPQRQSRDRSSERERADVDLPPGDFDLPDGSDGWYRSIGRSALSFCLSGVINAVPVLVLAVLTVSGAKYVEPVAVVMTDASEVASADDLLLSDADELQLDLGSTSSELDEAPSDALPVLPAATDPADAMGGLFGSKSEATSDEPGRSEFPSFQPGRIDASILQGRSGEKKAELLEQFGGTVATERSVEIALKWLANHQADDGSWSFDHKVDNRQSKCNCSGSGVIRDCRTGATAMALLPFLGAGHTHRKGKYRSTVERGLHFLTAQIRIEDGTRGSLAQGGGTMYAHGLSAMAICEAYAMTQDPALRQPAQLVINHTVYAQAENGGWRYAPKEAGDTSAVGWQLMALKSGQMGQLEVPDAVFDRAGKFLDGVSAQQGALYGYTSPGEGQTTTAVGLLSRMYTGWNKDHPPLIAGARRLSAWGPSKRSMYYNYYATQVMRHLNDQKEWPKWNAEMKTYLTKAQAHDETKHQFGSWYFGGDEHASVGGRLYHTSLATMTLEVYYRHLPLYRQDATTSHRPQ